MLEIKHKKEKKIPCMKITNNHENSIYAEEN